MPPAHAVAYTSNLVMNFDENAVKSHATFSDSWLLVKVLTGHPSNPSLGTKFYENVPTLHPDRW